MPAFWRHVYHLVWATHNRAPLITAAIEEALHHFLREKARAVGCTVYAVNGMADHVHMVLSIPPTVSVAEVVKELKGASSFHVNHVLAPATAHFAWQRGYGSLTVGERQRGIAVEYVARQKEHHATGTTNRWLEEHGSTEAEPDEQHSVKG